MCSKAKNKTKTIKHARLEARRKIVTLEPFTPEQLSEFLEIDQKLNDNDVKPLTDIIVNECTFHMDKVHELITFAKDEKTGTIDFDRVPTWIEAQKNQLIAEIAHICGTREAIKNLQNFVAEKKGEEFLAYDFVELFGRLEDPTTVGYRLLKANLVFYQVEKNRLVFYSPLVRKTISELPIRKLPETQ